MHVLLLALAAAAPSAEPLLVVTDPKILTELETHGSSFGERAFGLSKHTTLLHDLADTPEWTSIAAAIRKDLDALKKADRRAGVGMRYVHRMFDPSWLSSAATRLELVGVVTRLDRRAFSPEHCGELRFIYRLAYVAGSGAARVDSRLPMTANVVYWLDQAAGESCRELAQRFTAPQPISAEWLASRPRGELKAVELNLQSVRWPSTIRPDIAGHAEYFLRVFDKKPGTRTFIEAPLENTPDAEKISRDPKLKAELAQWIKNNLQHIDLGTPIIPEQFLAKKTTSVAPRGLARLANRPFRRIFSSEDFRGLELGHYQTIKTPAGLLRRLDGLTCTGCHQSRSVAGFHFLGEDARDRDVDAIAVAMSPHLAGELTRRRNYFENILNKRAANELRLSPEREGSKGELGAHCGLGDPSFADWTCASGLECVAIDEDEVGACHASGVGAACEVGRIVEHADPHRDRVKQIVEKSCGPSSICEATPVGFPGGMCATDCDSKDPDMACGGIAILGPFNECLAKKQPFADCVKNHTRPAGLRRCDQNKPCRDDYICARTSGTEAVCIPPYFLFQMRVDGHRL